ncbi:L-aspartate oxidase [Deferribacterales bacterium Es71-Z0220]|uniref:L-aspartate oxidase n=1 Tax=Deferrivibrio essentukiensis TaxID=2880922 RepID=UPI001F60D206|nr:L-aspartate oxidase [Deferrivibrio essentukiensis]MCB4204915.1 L-aspartate oxidase [Deferrivibrio essentukiensis]
MGFTYYDYIVLGSGVAGLRAAVELSKQGSVGIITKSFLGESNTEYAQGGVAVVLSDDDDIYLHYEDTIKAGDGLCDKDAVMTLVEEGPKYIKELIQMGAMFDMHGDHLSFTREAAHSVNRIIHAKGDATGHEIVRALKEYVSKIENIDKVENYFIVDLIKCGNKICGVVAINENENSFHYFYSKAVILATGGAGRLFERTTNPEVATGDGMAIAFRANATLKDMEFFQFHPTGLHIEGAPAFLLSESMRGEGAVLRNIHKERFCHNYHEQGELAPRDIVSRAIFFEMQKTNSKFVYMDLTHIDSNYLKNRFPKIYSTCLNYGIDITKDLIPVSPAAHYYMGGIETDIWGRTNIYGLYACGETACTGVHGANRLASNSLLEGVVFGARSAKAAIIDTKYDEPLKPVAPTTEKMDQSIDYKALKTELQRVMWENVSVIRNEKSLNTAINFIDKYLNQFLNATPFDRYSGEVRNMFVVGKLMAEAALARKGSRGGHFRDDYPEKVNDSRHIVFENAQFSPTIR